MHIVKNPDHGPELLVKNPDHRPEFLLSKKPILMGSFTLRSAMVIHPCAQRGGHAGFFTEGRDINLKNRFANPGDESYFSEESRPQVGILLMKKPTPIGSFTFKSPMDIHPRAQSRAFRLFHVKNSTASRGSSKEKANSNWGLYTQILNSVHPRAQRGSFWLFHVKLKFQIMRKRL